MFKYCLSLPKLQPEIPAAVTTDTDVQCATRGKPQVSFRPKMAHVHLDLAFVGLKATSASLLTPIWLDTCMSLLNSQQPPWMCASYWIVYTVQIMYIPRHLGSKPQGALSGPISGLNTSLCCTGPGTPLPWSLLAIPVRRAPVFSLHVPPVELFVNRPQCLSHGPFVLHADDKEIAAYM